MIDRRRENLCVFSPSEMSGATASRRAHHHTRSSLTTRQNARLGIAERDLRLCVISRIHTQIHYGTTITHYSETYLQLLEYTLVSSVHFRRRSVSRRVARLCLTPDTHDGSADIVSVTKKRSCSFERSHWLCGQRCQVFVHRRGLYTSDSV